MSGRNAWIVDGLRTPFGRHRGALSAIRADDLAALPISALMARHPALDWAALDEVVLGCANQAGEDNRNVARMAALLAGLPETVPALTVNRLCASGLDAVGLAARGGYDPYGFVAVLTMLAQVKPEESGASITFSTHPSPADRLAEALRKVHRGGRAVDPELAVEAWSESDPLNDRERQVLRLAGEGMSAGEIAVQLHLSQGTVRNYLSEIIGKLGVGNRIEAHRLARQKGWL